MRTLLLYFVTAMAEIVGCYLPWLWLKKGGSVWLLLPAAVSLAAFAWLLTLHEAASGRRGSTLHPDFRPFSESASSAGAGLTAATEKLLWWHVCNRLPQA